MAQIEDSGLQVVRSRLIQLESAAREADLIATQSEPVWTDVEACEITSPRVTAKFNYYGTGEGVTRGVAIFTVHNKSSLEASILNEFGSFFSGAVEVACGIHTTGFGESELIPEFIRKQFAEYLSWEGSLGNFKFAAVQHQNLA